MLALNTAVITPRAPEVLWAQRTDELFITINLSDVEEPNINLTPESLSFSGKSHGNLYEVKLDFFKELNVEASKQNVNARHIEFVLCKKETGQPYWPRLLKSSGKAHYLKTDFGKWKDEDDDDEPGSQFDVSNFGNMDLNSFGEGDEDFDENDLVDSDDEEEGEKTETGDASTAKVEEKEGGGDV